MKTMARVFSVILIVIVIALSDSHALAFQNRLSSLFIQHYTVELLFVMDFPAYQEWYQKTPGSSAADRRASTLDGIWRHYSSVVHGMNSIYRSLEPAGMHFNIRTVDVQVVGPEVLWPSYLVHPGPSSKDVIASEIALDSFYNWTQKSNHLPAFDHAMLVTGYDLMQNGDTSKSGRAYLGTICTGESVSIIENDFSSEVVQIAAHELGHSLGAKHDGEQNGCSDVDGYLMASVTEINSTNRWHFSPCSINYIQAKLYNLTRRSKYCLMTIDHNLMSSPIPELDIAMGQLYSPDQQCALLEGPRSYFCRDFYSSGRDYDHICSNMWCRVDSSDNLCNNYQGSDGYLCGYMKVCMSGVCVLQSTAPPVLDYCPQGDQPGIVWKNYTCAELARNETEMCYDNNTRARCCKSCSQVHTGVAGCEYGDKSSWCRKSMILPIGCYNNENLCCETCRAIRDPYRPECPFGDKSTWCATTLNPPFECYQNEALCCGTCATYFNASRIGCEYGDRSSWCETHMEVPYDCYRNRDLCCSTCDRYVNTSHVECEYGDRHRDCRSLQYPVGCYQNEDLCCATCAGLKRVDRVGCEYGDRSTWCSTGMSPQRDCGLNVKLCCGTCQYQDTRVAVVGRR